MSGLALLICIVVGFSYGFGLSWWLDKKNGPR